MVLGLSASFFVGRGRTMTEFEQGVRVRTADLTVEFSLRGIRLASPPIEFLFVFFLFGCFVVELFWSEDTTNWRGSIVRGRDFPAMLGMVCGGFCLGGIRITLAMDNAESCRHQNECVF